MKAVRQSVGAFSDGLFASDDGVQVGEGDKAFFAVDFGNFEFDRGARRQFGRNAGRADDQRQAVDAGKVRSIGLSNFSAAKAREILDVARIAPAVLQVEAHPYWNQHALKAELDGTGIVFEAWYPLGHGDRALLAEPALTEPAARYGKTAAQVVLRWHLQEGNVTFPKTLNAQHMADNIDIFDFALTEEEMARINALPQKPYYVVPDEPPAFATRRMDYSQQA